MLVKNLKYLISKFPFSLLNGKRFVFCYHDISSPNEIHHAPEHYSTTIDAFVEQIAFFKENCNLVSLEELVLKENLPKNKVHVAITFDDGFYSVLQNAHPVLKKENIPYSLFINKEAVLNNQLWVSNLILNQSNKSYLEKVYDNCLSKEIVKQDFLENPLKYISKFQFNEHSAEALRLPKESLPKTYLNLEEVKILKNEEVSIGNHTNHHFILSACNTDLQQKEINSNQTFIENELGSCNPFFAIPFGKKEHYTKETIDIATNNKLPYSMTSNVNPYSYNKEKIQLIPRIVITKDSIENIRFNMMRTLFKTYDL